jgi:hypothetical protein
MTGGRGSSLPGNERRKSVLATDARLDIRHVRGAIVALEVGDAYGRAIHFFRIHATRRLSDGGPDQGAFVSCWLKRGTIADAELVAKAEVESAGWSILAVEEARDVTEGQYSKGSSGLEYFRQAIVDDAVYVFSTWDEEESDENT